MNFPVFAASVTFATVAARGIYKFIRSTEKDVSAAAKRDIRTFLTNFIAPSDPSLVIRHVRDLFTIAFSPHHLSIRCVALSTLITTIYFVLFGVLTYLKYFLPPPPIVTHPYPNVVVTNLTVIGVPYQLAFFAYVFAFSVIPDYLSLGKGRIVLAKIQTRPHLWYMLRWVFIDLIISLLLGVSGFFVLVVTLHFLAPDILRFLTGIHATGITEFLHAEALSLLHIASGGTLFSAIFFSALVTTSWILLTVLSAMFLRGVGGSTNFILRFVRWYFPIKTHPIAACGMAAAIAFWIVVVMFGLIFSLI